MTEQSFTCPRCGMVSYHPRDIAEGYCGACHDFTDGMTSISGRRIFPAGVATVTNSVITPRRNYVKAE